MALVVEEGPLVWRAGWALDVGLDVGRMDEGMEEGKVQKMEVKGKTGRARGWLTSGGTS